MQGLIVDGERNKDIDDTALSTSKSTPLESFDHYEE
jgi:hypothetical protein